jgi:TolB-like protein
MSDQHISTASEATADAEPAKRKKDKVRAAWISFVGRIMAQFIGAAASIGLGLMFIHKYQDTAHPRADSVGLSAPATEKPLTLARQKREPTDTWIAVLPLEDFSPDGKQQQVANGLTEGLITALSNVEGLRVVSRTSSMRYKGMSKALPEIGRELEVNWIVEGSILLEGHRIRVTGQLIDTATDEHVWATAYDRQYQDALSFQASLSSEIAKDVEAAIGRVQRRRLSESTGGEAAPATVSTPRSSRRPAGIAGSRLWADSEDNQSPAIRSPIPGF